MSAEEHIQYVPESPAIDLRAVVWPAVAVLVLLAGSIAGLYAFYDRAVPIKGVPAQQQFPQPRVVTSDAETAERRRLAAEQARRLKTWAWANDQHTRLQIPIDRAMQLLEQKGGAAWEPLLPFAPALSSPAAGAENAVTPAPSNAPPPGGKSP